MSFCRPAGFIPWFLSVLLKMHAVPSHLCDSSIQLAVKVRYEQCIDYIWAYDLSNFRNNPQSTPLPTPKNPNPNITGMKPLNN